MSYGTTFNLKMYAFTQCCIRRITSRHAVLWISCNSTDSTSFFLPRPRQSESVGKARQRIDACEYAAGNAAACDISRSCNHQSPRHTGCSTEEAIIHSLGTHIFLTHKATRYNPKLSILGHSPKSLQWRSLPRNQGRRTSIIRGRAPFAHAPARPVCL